ncbi:MAG: dUTP diphosphatase [Candidatus Heimdallarchaeota archaeon]|nr:dUTP diphosphatase [Candidatus Heimdallarchaeota archaeon]
MTVEILVKKMNHDAFLPRFAYHDDAGADLFALESTEIKPYQTIKVRHGISIELPEGYFAEIRPRSGLSSKGITIANAPGTIDPQYRGELMTLLRNNTNKNYLVNKGDRVSQIRIQKIYQTKFIEVSELSETTRGESGFGSTGT